MSDKLKNYTSMHFWRLGNEPKVGVKTVSLSAYAILPLIPLWFDRSWPILVASVIYVSFFVYASIRKVTPIIALRQLRCLLAGKKRFNSKVNRAKRFTNADS